MLHRLLFIHCTCRNSEWSISIKCCAFWFADFVVLSGILFPGSHLDPLPTISDCRYQQIVPMLHISAMALQRITVFGFVFLVHWCKQYWSLLFGKTEVLVICLVFRGGIRCLQYLRTGISHLARAASESWTKQNAVQAFGGSSNAHVFACPRCVLVCAEYIQIASQ